METTAAVELFPSPICFLHKTDNRLNVFFRPDPAERLKKHCFYTSVAIKQDGVLGKKVRYGIRFFFSCRKAQERNALIGP